ncbi:MAG TPA: sulfite exporter TauE/SafE family protein [Armatimonadota bacterium]|nr:sulfite exporter TauE/SafE family protein [Armatimonadota bacterium]
MITLGIALGMFIAAAFAGLLGSMLGLGGGIIIIPALTLLFHVDFRAAAATSLLSVVATSAAGTMAYLRRGYTDIRLGLLLELATVAGAITGGFIAFSVSRSALQALFALLMLYTAFAMWRNLRSPKSDDDAVQEDETTRGFALHGTYFDPAIKREVTYRVQNFTWGMLGSAGAGIVSGLLGVGGGIIKVPIMRLKMKVPLKVASATSNYMIGITAATSVMLYFKQGHVDLPVTGICALGILLGAMIGPRIAAKIDTTLLQRFFVLILLFTAIQMIWRALSGGNG